MTERARWRALLFPDPERTFPAERWVRIGLRTAHLMSMAAYVGGSLFAVAPDRLLPALLLTVLTGVLFALLEMYGTCAWLFELRGLLTLLKVGLVGLIALWPEARSALLLAAVAIGSVSSHMPARFRYWTLFTDTHAMHRRG